MTATHWQHPESPYTNLGRRKVNPTWTKEEWETLERLRLAGWKWKDIARKIGRSENACKITWCRHGPSREYVIMQGLLWAIERDKTLLGNWRRLKGKAGELEEVGKRVLRIRDVG